MKYLVTPTEAGPWRVDVPGLQAWLAGRWPEGQATSASGQRATVWAWPDGYELWVPEDREVLWVGADAARVAAVATWCALTAKVPLVLTDEGYNDSVDLLGESDEHSLTERLNDG